MSVVLYTQQIAGSPEVVAQWAAERVQAMARECFALMQSFPMLEFKTCDKNHVSTAILRREVFSGRMFAPEAEIRWWREGEEVNAWFLSEQKPAAGEYEELACQAEKRNFYLLGFWQSARSGFSEPRLRRVLSYPVNHAKEMDRAYVEVHEYRPAKPAMDASMTDFMDCLNRPRVLAHRLLAVKTG